MHRSGIAHRGIAHRALGAARETGRPLAAVGNGAQPDRLDVALTPLAGDLARAWTKRRRTRGPSSGNGAAFQPTSEEH